MIQDGRATRVAATERRILDAARELFSELGYADTTLAAVAVRAKVGARTVYLRFGSKGSVLLRAAGLALDDGPDGDPAGVRPTGSDAIARYAWLTRERFERLGGLVGVLIQATAMEPFVADEMAQMRTANRRAAAAVVGRGRPELAETVAVLGSAEAWLQLTGPAGWDPNTYQRWLTDSIRVVTAR